MANRFSSAGFSGKPLQPGGGGRIPPGQHAVGKFPVFSAGPTPRTPLDQWTFTVDGLVREPVKWTWEEFLQLPAQEFVVDIHCVTKWSKLDTHWAGVSVDTLFEYVEIDRQAMFVIAFCDGGYTTNIPLPDLVNGQAFVAYRYGGKPLTPEHGSPARLVVPHLYLWKSAKWVRSLQLMATDKPGFWESLGYHNRGDPWKEERHRGD